MSIFETLMFSYLWDKNPFMFYSIEERKNLFDFIPMEDFLYSIIIRKSYYKELCLITVFITNSDNSSFYLRNVIDKEEMIFEVINQITKRPHTAIKPILSIDDGWNIANRLRKTYMGSSDIITFVDSYVCFKFTDDFNDILFV